MAQKVCKYNHFCFMVSCNERQTVIMTFWLNILRAAKEKGS